MSDDQILEAEATGKLPAPLPVRDRKRRYVVVGFTLKVIDTIDEYLPLAPCELADPELAADWNEKEKAKRDASALHCPHLATFASVFLTDLHTHTVIRFNAEGRGPGTGKPPVAIAVRNWLMENFPLSWTSTAKWPADKLPPQVIFVGFEPLSFLFQLAMECSLPENDKALPYALWDYREVIGLRDMLCVPPLDLPGLLRRRIPIEAEGAAAWTKLLEGWTGPGKDAMKDHHLAIELATQLGILLD
ncbi:MAG TPA: hypothetical protein VNM37_11695 [Candidatus Dormibacteraeota bacterium]|nr:hypothetical protein [Candidatus Dormibacteraeota bacterium]